MLGAAPHLHPLIWGEFGIFESEILGFGDLPPLPSAGSGPWECSGAVAAPDLGTCERHSTRALLALPNSPVPSVPRPKIKEPGWEGIA